MVSTWDIIAGTVSPSTGEILVYDDHGTDEALSCVERLAAAGCRVEIVTPDRYVGHNVTGTAYPAYLASFYAGGVRMTPDHRVTTQTCFELAGGSRNGGELDQEAFVVGRPQDHLVNGHAAIYEARRLAMVL